jgi:hypothetical protein
MREHLLMTDGVINLLLGILLLWYPTSLARSLGLLTEERPFFASILGAVLFGVGIALLIERCRPLVRLAGLGLGGAISINVCAALALSIWLLGGDLNLTALGQFAFWALVVLLLGLSAIELYAHLRDATD